MSCSLTSISPLDGRYKKKVAELRPFFSEQALILYRVHIELQWLRILSTQKDIPELRPFTKKEQKILEEIISRFSEKDAARIKEIERETNHDVKAVEYFLKEKFAKTTLKDVSEWLHFSCTSEDINNLAYALMLKKSIEQIILPELQEVQKLLTKKCREWKNVPMLARTHGQPASPTTMGKVWLNFQARLKRQEIQIERQEYLGKINGATGNFNAHVAAYPNVDWLKISEEFVKSLKLTWQPISDQIEPHDFIAEICHNWTRVNTILIDFARDIWGYIAIGSFKQELRKGEVGSSTMPHKVNPIDFENAEGNFGIANSLFHFFAEKLPISRWQRDLTDSTVMRNIGTAFGHTLLGFKSLTKGIRKLEINKQKLQQDLEENMEVLAEAAQTVMRKHGVKNPYEKLKTLTRGKRLKRDEYEKFVRKLDIPKGARDDLLKLTPASYIGLAETIVERFGK